MRRWLGWLAIAWLLVVCGVALVAYGGQSSRASLAQRTRDVALQLHCLACQGESVADSPSAFSASIRSDIRRRLQSGQSPDDIKASLVHSYGDRILQAPPASGVGTIAWLAPPALLLGGAGLLLTLVFDWRTRGKQTIDMSREQYLERVRFELATSDQESPNE